MAVWCHMRDMAKSEGRTRLGEQGKIKTKVKWLRKGGGQERKGERPGRERGPERERRERAWRERERERGRERGGEGEREGERKIDRGEWNKKGDKIVGPETLTGPSITYRHNTSQIEDRILKRRGLTTGRFQNSRKANLYNRAWNCQYWDLRSATGQV